MRDERDSICGQGHQLVTRHHGTPETLPTPRTMCPDSPFGRMTLTVPQSFQYLIRRTRKRVPDCSTATACCRRGVSQSLSLPLPAKTGVGEITVTACSRPFRTSFAHQTRTARLDRKTVTATTPRTDGGSREILVWSNMSKSAAADHVFFLRIKSRFGWSLGDGDSAPELPNWPTSAKVSIDRHPPLRFKGIRCVHT